MSITYDRMADCLYIEVSMNEPGSKIVGTVRANEKAYDIYNIWGTKVLTDISSKTMLDIGPSGEILGIEILNASKYYSSEFLDKHAIKEGVN